MTAPTLPATLVQALEDRTLIPFVGAGVSMAVTNTDGGRAFPSWPQLLDRAAARLDAENRNEHAVVRAMLGLAPPNYMEAARWARQGLGMQWAEFLEQTFDVRYSEVDPESLELARRIWRLGSNLVITTNYDRVLRWSCASEDFVEWQIEQPQGQRNAMRGPLGKPTIWHLHGSISDPAKIILSPDGYQQLYPDDTQKSRYQAALTTLRSLMTTHHLLFVGFSLDDAFLVRQLEWVRNTFRDCGSQHYVLARSGEVDGMRPKVEGLGVDFIEYADFGAPLLATLDELITVRERPPVAAPPPVDAGPSVPPVPSVPGSARGTAPMTTPSRVFDDEVDRYLTAIECLHKELPLAGFETKARVTIELDDLYVPLDAIIDHASRRRRVFSSAQQAQQLRAKGKHPEHRVEPSKIPLAEAFVKARSIGKGKRGVVLLGDPGSGKTTHLRKVLLKVVRDGPESIGLPPGTLPVFLPLRELRGRSQSLEGFVREQLRTFPLGMAPEFGDRLLARGKLLWLLDGLDEVSNADERAAVAQWTDDARKIRSDDFFLMTCRYAGYSPDLPLDAGFVELHLRPMNDEQVASFVRKWYRIVEEATSHDPRRAQALADDLLAAIATPELAASRRVNEMTRNPLMLTAICLVHRDRGELPTRRVALYYEATQILLERWRKVTKRLPVSFPAADARKVLQPAALWMHGKEERTRATAGELEPSVRHGLAAAGHPDVSAEHFLQAIRDESGLLTGWDVSSYGFMHLGFQEYLAARELRSRGFGDGSILRDLASRFGDSWWQEVILLMLALDEPAIFEPFMRVLVRQPTFKKWATSSTMQLVMNESAGISAAPLVELLFQRPSASEPDLESRQVAALRLLLQFMPEEAERLSDQLGHHPDELVRSWWARRRKAAGHHNATVTLRSYEFVRIAGGKFMMGSPPNVGYPDERPQQWVTLDSFLLGRRPVTNAQYEQFLNENPDVSKPEYWGDRRFNRAQQPVVGVSWYEAKQFCEWLGPNVMLPTEAQWEYACRAGAPTRYSFGDRPEDLGRFGWYDENSGGQSQPVGQKEPSLFGLYDMHGNVYEWCEDRFSRNYENAQYQPHDGLRLKPEGGGIRVIRGGSWFSVADFARSACRYGYVPDLRRRSVGLRPAQIIPGFFTSSRAPEAGKA